MSLVNDIHTELLSRALDVRWIGVPSWEDAIYVVIRDRIGRITKQVIFDHLTPEKIIEHIEW